MNGVECIVIVDRFYIDKSQGRESLFFFFFWIGEILKNNFQCYIVI